MIRRLLAAACAAALVASLGVSAVLAGEVTGNGKVLSFEGSKWGTGLHSRSECAYSGQEDLQYFVDEGTDSIPVANVVKGVPNHAQSWGQIPQDVRAFLTSIGSNPGIACNPTKSGGGE